MHETRTWKCLILKRSRYQNLKQKWSFVISNTSFRLEEASAIESNSFFLAIKPAALNHLDLDLVRLGDTDNKGAQMFEALENIQNLDNSRTEQYEKHSKTWYEN